MEGNEWNWTGTNRFERDGTGLDGAGRDQTPPNELDRIKLDWSTRQRSGLDWTGLSRTAFQKTELDGTAPNWTGLSLPDLDFTRLHYTALPWIELESTIHDSQFTAPRLTDLHRTAIHVSK